jgi:hypothetical protein
MYPAEFHDI